ncbi:outer membrane lipoprotein-sorting protein [Chitinophaga oryzae]|uniref:Outer membrane lipoprotein-sorting protein n=1 Tax=Chitinophaga oryzae TaxID=2725414 RepID=A0AAE7D6Q4_9BACT|nr:outer membrane lipoprotein-sorting protein [Chitinophaga oryzae]QJB31980.1 outer membrane lipoprotein-sorting protein [Chitinophaga oryzae]QJB38458.1 outer membrane lipoprotein-sorting protein [Chitinophaga oryzae]
MKVAVAIFFIFSSLISFAQEASEIVRKADEKMRGSTMRTEMVIRVFRPAWSREMQCKIWMKGNDQAMILITSPAKDKGIVFLKRKKEVWNWMPVLERTIKLPPSMMSQSWMGTDFTNDDLIKESSVVEDYNHTIIGDTVIRNRSCYIILMIPKPTAAIIWSKVIVCIDKEDFLELHSRFYDDDGRLINTMNSYDIKMMHDRIIPTRFEMIPADKKGQKTEMIYKSVLYNKPIDDGFFSTEKMKTLN